MKTLQECTKEELIKYIEQIQPKAKAYERVCNQLGIDEFIIGVDKPHKKYYVAVICKDFNDFIEWRTAGCYDFTYSALGWFDVIQNNVKIRYYAITGVNRLIGLRVEMIIETDFAKENPQYNNIIRASKASLI